MIGDREASLDSVLEEMPSFNFTEGFDKTKITSLRLATFSIFMTSFNISTPLTISTGETSISIGHLKVFFIIFLIYQLYILKCLIDDFSLSAESNTGGLKQKYYYYLLCRRAAMKLKKHELVDANSDIEFKMNGIDIGRKTHHAPAIIRAFESSEELERWRSELRDDFSFKQNTHNNTWMIFLTEASVSEEDIKYWHKYKKRLYYKLRPVHNHYYIPVIYSVLGLCTTILMIFPALREWLVSLIPILQ